MSTAPFRPEDTSVLVLDHVRLHRENLVARLAREPSISRAAGVADGIDSLPRLGRHEFTVVLVNMTGRQTTACCCTFVQAVAPTPLIAYALPCSYTEVVSCAEAGVAGYLLDDEPHSELIKAVTAVSRGDICCPPRVAAMLMHRMGPRGARADVPDGLMRLTPREREILELIDRSMSNKEIARALCIEVRTVKNHVHNLLEKLEVHRRVDAAALVRQRLQKVSAMEGAAVGYDGA
jgi:two-component system, NarL family, nitrate/nitrite response regulator NarL